jgi:hypothetical protein
VGHVADLACAFVNRFGYGSGMTDDLGAFPHSLELVEVIVPSQTRYVLGSTVVYVPSVELWNEHTVIRRVWPAFLVDPAAPPNEVGPMSEASVMDERGVEYGYMGGQTGNLDNGVTFESIVRTMRPLPAEATRLIIRDGWTDALEIRLR